MLRCNEWKNLSPAAKLIYIYLKSKFNGQNNGEIKLYYSELKGIRGISAPSTAAGGFKELELKGWINRIQIGGMYRYFNIFRLTGKHDDSL